MERWYPILGLVFMVAALAYAAWKVWQMGRRGWTDHLWIWKDANRAARFMLVIFTAQIVGRWAWRGWSDEVLAFIIGAAIIVPIPYMAYTIGRLLGIRDRVRHGARLS
ncbi:MAG: hypothetical protein GW858_11950 [Sphingomonadales bacterium]|nr:hypothetical protein [Sphingomonadales bacterium]NCT02380.1 hypothetical protein [Sphingomonadales bacterium]